MPLQVPTNEPKIMIVGEAPGRNEVALGIPFCGASGMKLKELLSLANLSILNTVITNAVKCRPLDNRTPTKEEIAYCVELNLREEIEHYALPIISLGKSALEAIKICLEPLINEESFLKKICFKEYATTKMHKPSLLVLPHPAFFLYKANKIQEKETVDVLKKFLLRNRII